MSNQFKICILAAGRGTRNNDVEGLHKALLPLENKAVLSNIISNFDKKNEIVIAVGYKGDQIKSYMNLVHSDRKITYVDVDNYDQPGSGPGYSLLACKDELQCPFIFTSADTIVSNPDDKNAFMLLSENWIGASNINLDDSLSYCLIKNNSSGYLEDLYFGKGKKAFIGLAGIFDYKSFWKSLQNKDYGRRGEKDDLREFEVASGFEGLNKVKTINFEWHDTGNTSSYRKTKEIFCEDIVANKSDEALFIDKYKVIKYFDNSEKINIRFERVKYLNGMVPKIKIINKNMYFYDYVNGKVLSEVYEEDVLKEFLNFSQDRLFGKFVNFNKSDNFIENCKLMYEDKTKKRLSALVGSKLDAINKINGVEVPPINDLLKMINWNLIYDTAVPSCFHGDLQLENIIYDNINKTFVLIDWREKFGESLDTGDVYYDLSKIHHSLLINGKSILNGNYSYSIKGDTAFVSFTAKNNLIYFMKIFEDFCRKNKYDWTNVEILSALHYLNISTLYENFQNGEYGRFLFLYGKYLLTKILRDNHFTHKPTT